MVAPKIQSLGLFLFTFAFILIKNVHLFENLLNKLDLVKRLRRKVNLNPFHNLADTIGVGGYQKAVFLNVPAFRFG